MKFSGLLSLANLAARRRPSASGPSRASRASCTLTMASVRWSSRGVSDVASNGTMPSVSDSDSCSQNTARWTKEHILIIPFVKAPNRGTLFSTLAHTHKMTTTRTSVLLFEVNFDTNPKAGTPQFLLHNLPDFLQGLWTVLWSRGLFIMSRLFPPHSLLLWG